MLPSPGFIFFPFRPSLVFLSFFPRAMPLWSRTAKNPDESTGPLARPFARSLAPLTRSLAPDCSLRSRPPLRSLVRSLAHFARSLARGTVNDWIAILSVFFSIFDHSESVVIDSSLCSLSGFLFSSGCFKFYAEFRSWRNFFTLPRSFRPSGFKTN